MSYKTSIIGIDGSGKSSTISLLDENLGKKYSVRTVKRYTSDTTGLDEDDRAFGNFMAVLDKVSLFGDRKNSKLLVKIPYALHIVLLNEHEKRAEKKYDPDIMLFERDMFIDPLVYSSFYCPFISKIDLEKRASVLRRILRMERPNDVNLIDISPETAIERIDKRCKELKAAGNITRVKNDGRHLHENPQDLPKIRDAYFRVMDYIDREFPDTDICIASSENMTPSEVAYSIGKNIEKNIEDLDL